MADRLDYYWITAFAARATSQLRARRSGGSGRRQRRRRRRLRFHPRRRHQRSSGPRSRRPLCGTKSGSRAYSRIVVRAPGGRSRVSWSSPRSRCWRIGRARGLDGPQPRPLRPRRAREISTRRLCDDFGETIARFPAAGRCELFTEWRSAVELQSASTRIDGPVSTTRRRPLWSTYDQLKLSLAGLAARRVTLWSCWAPRVPRFEKQALTLCQAKFMSTRAAQQPQSVQAWAMDDSSRRVQEASTHN